MSVQACNAPPKNRAGLATRSCFCVGNGFARGLQKNNKGAAQPPDEVDASRCDLATQAGRLPSFGNRIQSRRARNPGC